MKAYIAWDNASVETYSTIVFAVNSKEAKKIAFCCDVCEDADYIQVRVKRLPEADKLHKGERDNVALALFHAGYEVRQFKRKDGNKTVIDIEYRKGLVS